MRRATVEGLLARAASRPNTVDVEVDGDTVTMQVLRDASQIMRMEREVKLLERTCQGAPPEAWAPWLPVDTDVMRMCHYVSEAAAHPRITFVQALQLAKLDGQALATLFSGLSAASGQAVSATEEEAIESLGETSDATGSGAPF
jgi:hypothetical protein